MAAHGIVIRLAVPLIRNPRMSGAPGNLRKMPPKRSLKTFLAVFETRGFRVFYSFDIRYLSDISPGFENRETWGTLRS